MYFQVTGTCSNKKFIILHQFCDKETRLLGDTCKCVAFFGKKKKKGKENWFWKTSGTDMSKKPIFSNNMKQQGAKTYAQHCEIYNIMAILQKNNIYIFLNNKNFEYYTKNVTFICEWLYIIENLFQLY